MTDSSAGKPTRRAMAAPRDKSELGRYLAEAPLGFTESEVYQKLLDGDYREWLDALIYICSVFAEYLESLVNRIIDEPNRANELEPAVRSCFEVIETLSKSEDEMIQEYVITGIFECFDSAERDDTFNTIVNNLGPSSRALWDEWIPRGSTRVPVPGAGLKFEIWPRSL